jgi:hypothetical protein
MFYSIEEKSIDSKSGHRKRWLTFVILAMLALALVQCKNQPKDAGMSSTRYGIKVEGNKPIDAPTMSGKHYGKPGENADLALKNGDVPGAKLTWTPPPGASNFKFPENMKPIGGGPPFVWNNVGANTSINVNYDLPNLPPGEDFYSCSNTLTAEDGEGNYTTSSYVTEISESFANLAAAEQAMPETDPRSSLLTGEIESGQESQADTHLWYTEEILNSNEISMTTQTCQDLFAVLQQENVFQAIRVPAPSPTTTHSYTMPVVYQKGRYPTITLHDKPWIYSPVVSGTLEYRYHYFTFLENEMPSVAGEHWLALGLSASEPITCPEGIAYPPDGWSITIEMWMDIPESPADPEAPVVLTSFNCYEGSNAVAQLSGLFSQGSATQIARTSANGYYEEITCAGPQYLFMDDEPDLILRGSETHFITPTQTISFAHTILNAGDTAISVTLETSSTLETEWHIYAQPDGSDQITDPVHLDSVANNSLDFWIIGEVPAGAAEGSHTVMVTATSNTEPPVSVWAADTIWIGPLDIPPSPETNFRLYLPALFR